MTTATAVVTRRSPIAKYLVPGLLASLVLGMWQMVLEALLPNGAGFWAPVSFISATVLRGLQGVAAPVPFQLVPVLLGLMGHMMNSIILGAVFAALIGPRIKAASGLLIAGILFGVVVMGVMWLVVVPAVDPVMLRLSSLVFLLGHMMWGAALGLTYRHFSQL